MTPASVCLAACLGLPLLQAPPKANTAERLRELRTAVADLRQAPPGSRQGDDIAERIDDLAGQIPARAVDDDTLQSVIALLDLPDHTETGTLAMALGSWGPRARAAAPRLLHLLPQYDCRMTFGVSEADVIRQALRRMGVRPPPPHCPHGSVTQPGAPRR